MKIIEVLPCGYIIIIHTGFFDSYKFKSNGICPMHGKDCKKILVLK